MSTSESGAVTEDSTNPLPKDNLLNVSFGGEDNTAPALDVPRSSKPADPTTNTPRQKGSQERRSPLFKRRSHLSEDERRDSGMAQSLSTQGNDPVADFSDASKVETLAASLSIPSIVVQDETTKPAPSKLRRTLSKRSSSRNTPPPDQPTSANEPFTGLATSIPTGEMEDPFSSTNLEFSKRGSLLFGGKKLNVGGGKQRPTSAEIMAKLGLSEVSGVRSLSTEDRNTSQRVQSMYEPPQEKAEKADRPRTATDNRSSYIREAEDTLSDLPTAPSTSHGNHATEEVNNSEGTVPSGGGTSEIQPVQAAGGLEDFTDVDVKDVDRYGFIKPRTGKTSGASTPVPGSPNAARNSRAGGLAATNDSPRKNRQGRPSYDANNNRLSVVNNTNSSRTNLRTSPSVMSSRTKRSNTSSLNPFRPVSRRSNFSRNRRWLDESHDMLTFGFGPADDTQQESPEMTSSRRTLEVSRAAKWEKMAKPVKSTLSAAARNKPIGAGAELSFDSSDPKVIARTWKGIPDRWRATAWHSFLTSSAAKRSPNGIPDPPDAQLIEAFHALQERDCADDEQIDMDVPRTVGAHVMFRRRYQGGQRLLFRVLRALALYFPATGYVQGMASVAATLLSYYAEEQAFVMLVRLWTLRGLGALYAEGFGGLMAALEDFESRWLSSNTSPPFADIARQLKRLDIAPSAYGTKWFLTLFNYSVPFEAQLRIWDVLMLCGDPPANTPGYTLTPSSASAAPVAAPSNGGKVLGKGHFEVLHAVAAALLQGMGELLLDADFENAMGVLTSPVPVANADVLMRVARRCLRERGAGGIKGR